MSEVKAISFGFENCEGCEIPIEYVWHFSINEITKLKTYHCSNGMREYAVVNKLHVQFEKKFDDYTDKTDYGDFVVTRVSKYNDICWFGIIYEDGSKEDYMVGWKGEDQYSNAAQKTTHEEWGFLVEVGYE